MTKNEKVDKNMRLIKQKYCLLLLSLLFTCQGYSADYWKQSMHDFYQVQTFAVIGDTMFAGTDEGGVFFSEDFGDNWISVNNGLNCMDVHCLTTIGTNIFAITGSLGGLYISDNYGKTWDSVNNGLTEEHINCMAANGENLFVGTYDGLFLSSDNGVTWLRNNFTGVIIESIEIEDGNIYVGTLYGSKYGSYGHIYLSTDNGEKWISVYESLNDRVISLAANKNIVIAATYNDSLILSTNMGKSWKRLDVNDFYEIYCLEISDNNIYVGTNCGLFISTDLGITWSRLDDGNSAFYVTSIIVLNQKLIIIESQEIKFSSDLGASWLSKRNGLDDDNILTMVAYKNHLFAGTGENGIYHSTDQGNSWATVNNGLSNKHVNCISVKDSIMFAGTFGGVFVSYNNGETWSSINTGLTDSSVERIVINGNDIFAATYKGGVLIFDYKNNCWTSVNDALKNSPYFSMAVNNNNIYLGTTSGGVFLSTDNGNEWKSVNCNKTDHNVNSIAFNGTSIFLGTGGDGVFLSTNNGSSWSSINNRLNYLYINCLATINNNIFAGTNQRGVFLSTNNGDLWRIVNNGTELLPINYLLIKDTIIYAAMEGKGVFRAKLSDFGIMTIVETHESFQNDFSISPNPATNYIKISYSPLEKGVRGLSDELPVRIYNVFGEEITTPALRATLPYEGGGNSSSQYSILTTQYSAKIDVSGLPAGVYFVRVGERVGKFLKI